MEPRATCLVAADVDCDGGVDSVDALNILRRVVGGYLWIDDPPGCQVGLLLDCGHVALPQNGTYIALGDSLSAGVGASDPDNAFVPRVHDCLGAGFELNNLGHSGDTSDQLISHGHVAEAVATIEERKADADPDNDVRLITLEIGGNDLLQLFFSLVLPGTCPTLEAALEKPECIDALRDTLNAYRPNLEQALGDLREADPDVPIVMFSLYNPLSGILPGPAPLADLALEGMPGTAFPGGLNDLMREVAIEEGAFVADVYNRFQGQSSYIAGDFIHPNDTGYGVIARAVLAAIGIAYEP